MSIRAKDTVAPVAVEEFELSANRTDLVDGHPPVKKSREQPQVERTAEKIAKSLGRTADRCGKLGGLRLNLAQFSIGKRSNVDVRNRDKFVIPKFQ
jgi:hypothetical protein